MTKSTYVLIRKTRGDANNIHYILSAAGIRAGRAGPACLNRIVINGGSTMKQMKF